MAFSLLSSHSDLEKELAHLREENAKLKAGSDISWFSDHPVPGFIVSVKSGKILEINHAALRQYRYDRKDLLDRNLDMLRAAGSGLYSRIDVESVLQNKAGWTVKQQRRDGTIFAAEMIVHPIQYHGGPADFVQVWDVSRRVDAELTQRSIERRYQWLMEHATESLWRFELEVPIPVGLPVDEQINRFYRFGYLAEASASTARFYGYSSTSSMIGLRLELFLPRNKTNELYLRNFIQHGYKLFDAETLERDADGNAKWFLNRLFGEVEGGLFVRVWGASLDVSDSKRVEASHKQSDQLWRDALENLQLLALFLDHEGHVTYVNPFFSRITGWKKEEILGQNFYRCLYSDHASQTEEYLRQLHSKSIRHYATNTFRTRAGESLVIRWNNTIIHDATGQPVGVFSIGEDVTEQQRTNQALQESEERYRRLVDGLPLGLYRSTPEGQLTFCNPMVLHLLELKSIEEASKVNLNQYEYGPSYSRKEFRDRMETEGAVYGLEYPWKMPNGTQLWVREHARAIRNEQGNVYCYEGTLEDITEEKHATQSIREREEHYRMLSHLAPIGIAMTCNGKIAHVNQYLATMLGYDSPSELEGTLVLDSLHPADREGALHYQQKSEFYGLVPPQERRLLKKDGSALLVQANVAIVRVNNERGSVIVVRNISEERHAEHERRRWQQRILEMQKLESLGLLAGGLAHDFNNQLTVILGHTNLVQMKLKENETVQGLIQPIEQAARHSMDLCQQMLSFAGRGKIKVNQVNLTQLIEELSGLLKIAGTKKARLVFELSESLPLLQAEEAQLRQVLINLVSNSAESLPSDQVGTITVKTGVIHIDETYKNAEITLELPKGDYAYLDVTDTGAGMDVNTRRRVFEPFFTTKPTGRGLGLPAVLGIVRSHGGAIEVTSKLRHGTTFRVFLPLLRPTQNVPILPEAVSQTQAHQTVLIVDDEASLRSLAGKVLGNHGWNVLEAEDGASACELLRQHGNIISLVIIDLVMPGMDGVETLRQLWKVQPTLPAIAMSSYGSAELEQRFTGFPLRGILSKPFSPASLEQAVMHVLGTTR
ncbi:MAG TPA: PAS domain S-box protein [Gemmatales bacterium]|nr:PAS domain S-box protein [Gemmatales bacterium]